MLSISSAMGLASIYWLQVMSSNTAGTFVFLNSSNIFKVDFFPKINIFFIFKTNTC